MVKKSTLLFPSMLRFPSILTCTVIQPRQIHTSQTRNAEFDDFKKYTMRQDKYNTDTDFLEFNDVVYAPTKDGEEPRPAVCYNLIFIKLAVM